MLLECLRNTCRPLERTRCLTVRVPRTYVWGYLDFADARLSLCYSALPMW